MTALDEARAHLAKAREFLEAAELTNDLQLFNAAASNAVTSGINSKDAICLALTGRTRKSDNHAEAVAELCGTEGSGTSRPGQQYDAGPAAQAQVEVEVEVAVPDRLGVGRGSREEHRVGRSAAGDRAGRHT